VNEEIARVLSSAEVRERFTNIGTEPAPSSPDEFGALVRSEMARLGKVIKEAGIRDQ
jgi:tripartite-type tricarboxylate transporter receptor subunit TctC